MREGSKLGEPWARDRACEDRGRGIEALCPCGQDRSSESRGRVNVPRRVGGDFPSVGGEAPLT